eukprot:6888839-Alexandrium_andersonii.AAC.1
MPQIALRLQGNPGRTRARSAKSAVEDGITTHRYAQHGATRLDARPSKCPSQRNRSPGARWATE